MSGVSLVSLFLCVCIFSALTAVCVCVFKAGGAPSLQKFRQPGSDQLEAGSVSGRRLAHLLLLCLEGSQVHGKGERKTRQRQQHTAG